MQTQTQTPPSPETLLRVEAIFSNMHNVVAQATSLVISYSKYSTKKRKANNHSLEAAQEMAETEE
jgi:hypothetical protein